MHLTKQQAFQFALNIMDYLEHCHCGRPFNTLQNVETEFEIERKETGRGCETYGSYITSCGHDSCEFKLSFNYKLNLDEGDVPLDEFNSTINLL